MHSHSRFTTLFPRTEQNYESSLVCKSICVPSSPPTLHPFLFRVEQMPSFPVGKQYICISERPPDPSLDHYKDRRKCICSLVVNEYIRIGNTKINAHCSHSSLRIDIWTISHHLELRTRQYDQGTTSSLVSAFLIHILTACRDLPNVVPSMLVVEVTRLEVSSVPVRSQQTS